MAAVRIDPAGALRGTLRVPPDKSLTHRALLLGAVSDGPVRVARPLESADTAATLGAIQSCAVRVDGDLGDEIVIHGVGLRGLRASGRIDCGNSGTLMRLIMGILVGQRSGTVVLDGDASLSRRPMARVADPLRAAGAAISTAPGGLPPVEVTAGMPLAGTVHDLPVASAQVKSAALLAGLFAEGETVVSEPAPSRDHTERMLAAAGVSLTGEGLTRRLTGPVDGIQLPDLEVPGDFSSAAPFLAAGALIPGSEITLQGVNLNPARAGLLEVMRRMGADVEVASPRRVAGEPCGDIVVRGGAELVAASVEAQEVPSLIDELPLVALLGAHAQGVTVVTGAAELRVKETDRIATTSAALEGIGLRLAGRPDGFTVEGPGTITGGRVDAAGDHRLAMLGAVAALASGTGVAVEDFACVAVSYPGFARDLATLGAAA